LPGNAVASALYAMGALGRSGAAVVARRAGALSDPMFQALTALRERVRASARAPGADGRSGTP